LKITLDEGALLAIIAATAEVYKKECYGLLVGTKQKQKNNYKIIGAIVAQKAERKHGSVEFDWGYFATWLKTIKMLPNCEVLGEFHSHPQFGGCKGLKNPSEGDMLDMIGPIQMIVSANDAVYKRRRFRVNKNGSISGVINYISVSIQTFDALECQIPIVCKFLGA
jgi:proteasome lid subunit RPN8/RPN11